MAFGIIISCKGRLLDAKKFVTPFLSVCCMFKYSFNLGLRISIPIKITFFPNKANDAAKLLHINDLPSPLTLDVTKMTFSFWLVSKNCILVRINLNNSAPELY